MSSGSQSSRSESKSSVSSESSSGTAKKKASKNPDGTKNTTNETKKAENNTELKDENKKFRIRIERVGKDVTIAHLLEIFGTFTEPCNCEFPTDDRKFSKRRYAFMDYLQESQADEAVLYMNGAQLNGVEISVAKVDPNAPNTQGTVSKKRRGSENSFEHKKRKSSVNKDSDRNHVERGRDKKPIASAHNRDRTTSWRQNEEEKRQERRGAADSRGDLNRDSKKKGRVSDREVESKRERDRKADRDKEREKAREESEKLEKEKKQKELMELQAKKERDEKERLR